MNDLKPWQCHPDLNEERLRDLAQFFVNTRREVLAEHDITKGDDSWSLGCRSNAWWRNRLLEVDKSLKWPWFSVIAPGKRFIFNIGQVPVRFFRGKPDRPPSSTLAFCDVEVRQLSFAFEKTSSYSDLKWRFIVETGFLGEVTKIIFAGLTEVGEVVCYWEIPFEAKVISLPVHSAQPVEAIELPPPIVSLPKADDYPLTDDANSSERIPR